MSSWYDDLLVLMVSGAHGAELVNDFSNLVSYTQQVLPPTADVTKHFTNFAKYDPPHADLRGWVARMSTDLDLKMGVTSHAPPPPERLPWGRSIWNIIHMTSLWKNNHYFSTFINTLSKVLPCETCRVHMIQYMSDHPIGRTTDNFEWAHAFHTAVNLRLGNRNIDLEAAHAYYTALLGTPSLPVPVPEYQPMGDHDWEALLQSPCSGCSSPIKLR